MCMIAIFVRDILVKHGNLKFDHQQDVSEWIFILKHWSKAIEDHHDEN